MKPKNLCIIELPVFEQDDRSKILSGLKDTPKRLPTYLLYDERGSVLFEKICETPEYYLTRAEVSILKQNSALLAEWMGSAPTIIEPGAGNLRKAEYLLQHVSAATYRPIDVSSIQLEECATRVATDFPKVRVEAFLGSFSDPAWWPPLSRGSGRGIMFFPGSTIGNFEPEEAVGFLSKCREHLGAGAAAIVGVDLKKNTDLLDAAYNDSEGVTSEFEKNILVRINREFGTDFDLNNFDYRGFYNPARGRVEMYLQSRKDHVVSVPGGRIHIRELELIHIENSYKYSIAEFQALAHSAGWKPTNALVDRDSLFSVHFLEAQGLGLLDGT